MKPLEVKIWIEGCCALHVSTSGELTTIVPSRVFPVPLNSRSTLPVARTELSVVGLEAVVFVDFALLGVLVAEELEPAPWVP
jgi:hypothetical protein